MKKCEENVKTRVFITVNEPKFCKDKYIIPSLHIPQLPSYILT